MLITNDDCRTEDEALHRQSGCPCDILTPFDAFRSLVRFLTFAGSFGIVACGDSTLRMTVSKRGVFDKERRIRARVDFGVFDVLKYWCVNLMHVC